MSAPEYKPGEKLRVTLEVTVHRANDGVLHLSHGEYPKYGILSVPLDQPGVTIARLVPAEGMPQAGDLWETVNGTRVLAVEDPWGRIELSDGKKARIVEDLLKSGPLKLVYRDAPTPEVVELRERLRSTPFGDAPADEPETVPIGGIPHGAIVTHPDWNDGLPVRVVETMEAGEHFEEVSLHWQDLTDFNVLGSATVPADFQVTPRGDL